MKMFPSITLGFFLLCGCSLEEVPADTNNSSKLIASFSFNNGNCDIPCELEFINESAFAESYLWTFGDGTQSIDPNPIHLYDTCCAFTVKLVAFNADGQKDSTEQNIKINNQTFLKRFESLQRKEFGLSIAQLVDNSFMLVGFSRIGFGPASAYITRFDSVGNTMSNFPLIFPNWEARYIINDRQDNVVIVGSTDQGSDGSSDIFLIKTDPDFNPLPGFPKIIGGQKNEHPFVIKQTSDGGYIIGGCITDDDSSKSDFYISKVDPGCNQLWHNTITTDSSESISNIIELSNGDFAAVGKVTGSREKSLFVRTDLNGNILSQKLIDAGKTDILRDIVETSSGSLAVCGWSSSFTPGESIILDVWNIEGESVGGLFPRIYDQIGNEYGMSILLTEDDEFIILGECGPFNARDFCLIKVNSSGILLWDHIYDTGLNEIARQVIKTKDGGYMMVGWTGIHGTDPDSDIFVIKVDQNGLMN